MAIQSAKKRRIGNELIDWIYLGIRAGARDFVRQYEAAKATRPVDAEKYLREAVNMPLLARARINEARRVYELKNGVGTFNTQVASCLVLTGSGITLAEINTELTTMESEVATIKAARAGGSTLDQIAALVLATWEDERADWTFRVPDDYVALW